MAGRTCQRTSNPIQIQHNPLLPPSYIPFSLPILFSGDAGVGDRRRSDGDRRWLGCCGLSSRDRFHGVSTRGFGCSDSCGGSRARVGLCKSRLLFGISGCVVLVRVRNCRVLALHGWILRLEVSCSF